MTPTAHAPRDNLLGICNAVGEDFGFNPLYLRLALAVTLLLDYQVALGTYMILGVSVLVSRALTRAPRAAKSAARTPVFLQAAPLPAARPNERVPELVG
jgi:phage shock protein C